MERYVLDMISPIPEYRDEADTTPKLAPRPASLDGKVIGLLPNWRPSAVEVLQAVGAALQRRFQIKELVLEQPVRELPVTKGKIIDGIRQLLDELRSRVDVVVTASGD